MAVANVHSFNTTERNGTAVVGAPRGANTDANDPRYRLNTAGEGAQARVTITGTVSTSKDITIIDAAGVSKTYSSASSTSATAGEFVHSDAGAAATGLKACIEHANGHNGSIVVHDDTAGKLILVQATTGSAGNTAITHDMLLTTTTDFTGGKFGSGVNDAPDVAGQHTKWAQRFDDPRYYSGDAIT